MFGIDDFAVSYNVSTEDADFAAFWLQTVFHAQHLLSALASQYCLLAGPLYPALVQLKNAQRCRSMGVVFLLKGDRRATSSVAKGALCTPNSLRCKDRYYL